MRSWGGCAGGLIHFEPIFDNYHTSNAYGKYPANAQCCHIGLSSGNGSKKNDFVPISTRCFNSFIREKEND